MVEYWYVQEFAEFRLGHHVIVENMLNISRVATNIIIYNNITRVITLMNAVSAIGLTIVTVPFTLFIALIYVMANREYMTALYTFEIMSPDTVLNNKYVLSIFKKVF